MTLSSTASRIRYEGDGATSSFPVPFKFFDNAHVRVTLRDAADQETLWSEGTEYGLTGAGNDSGGTLTVVTAPQDFRPRAGESLVIALVVPFTQEKSFPLGGAFPSTQVEEGFDLAVQRDAQLTEFDRRVMSVPASDTQVGKLELAIDSLRAGKYLGFDATGKPAFLAGTAEAADLSDKTVLPTGAGEARSLADLFGLGALTAENVRLYGAKGDTRELTDGSVTDGATLLSSGSVGFTEADIGKDITVEGAATTGVTITNVEKAPADNVVQFDASAGTSLDQTAAFNDAAAGDVTPFPATEAAGDMFLIGHRVQFSSVTIDIGTPGVGGAVTWKYWDGTAWQNLAGVSDGTAGLTAAAGNQTLTFTLPVDWETRRFNEKDNGDLLYYIAAEVTTLYTTDPVLDQGTIDDGEIRVTTSAEHGFQAGQSISIKGVVGATAANGTHVIRHARSANNINRSAFDLIGSTFGSAYVSGGTAHGRLITSIASVSGGNATLNADAGASIAGTTRFRYGSDDTAAIQAAIDSGKTVVIPAGNYISGGLSVATKGQKIIGMGGRIIARSTSSAFVRQADVTADEVTLEDLILENPDEQTQAADPRPAAIHLQANKARVAGCRIAGYQDGILVSSSGEYFGTVIEGCHILGIVGRSDESRGDGITSWGADTVIAGNYVTAKGWDQGVGMQGDPRIGIHVEGLSPFHAENSHRYEDSGAAITGNIVRGKFRRGIFSEAVAESTISGNIVAGSTWWAIGMSGNQNSGPAAIVGNTILYDRPSQDETENSATPAAIEVRAVNTILRGMQVIGNTVAVRGTGAGVELIGQSTDLRDVVVSGNSFVSTNLSDPGMVNAIKLLNVHDLSIADNIMCGCSASMIFAFNWQRATVMGNKVSEVFSSHCMNFGDRDNLTDQYAVFKGNSIIWGGSGGGIRCFNQDNFIAEGNFIKNASGAGNAMELFGTDPAIVSGNIMTMASGNYLANYTPGATKLDVNNIKN